MLGLGLIEQIEHTEIVDDIPTLFDRESWEEWEATDRPGPREAAREKVRRLLDSHQAEPLDERLEAEILDIIEAHEGGKGGESDE